MSTLRERAIKLCTRFFLVTTTFYWPVVGSQMIADSIGRDLYTVLTPMYPISLAISLAMYYKNDWIKQAGTVDKIKEDVVIGYMAYFFPHISVAFLCKGGYLEPAVRGWLVLFNFFVLHLFNSGTLLVSENHCHYDYSKGRIVLVVIVIVFNSILHKSYLQNTPHFIVQVFGTVSACYAVMKLNTIFHDGVTVVHR